jgi:hypothetical protein
MFPKRGPACCLTHVTAEAHPDKDFLQPAYTGVYGWTPMQTHLRMWRRDKVLDPSPFPIIVVMLFSSRGLVGPPTRLGSSPALSWQWERCTHRSCSWSRARDAVQFLWRVFPTTLPDHLQPWLTAVLVYLVTEGSPLGAFINHVPFSDKPASLLTRKCQEAGLQTEANCMQQPSLLATSSQAASLGSRLNTHLPSPGLSNTDSLLCKLCPPELCRVQTGCYRTPHTSAPLKPSSSSYAPAAVRLAPAFRPLCCWQQP